MAAITNPLHFYGASDDCVEFEGPINDEFYLPESNVWLGTLQAADGSTAQIKASYCVDNPDGWHVEVTDYYGECPWEVVETIRTDSPEDEPDPMLTIFCPPTVVLQEDA